MTSTGRKSIRKNISFAALGQEECDGCLYYKEHTCSKKDDTNHAGTTDDVTPECDICMGHENHVMKAKETRKAYQIDSSKVNNHDEAYISVDLQKVVMLPRLPGVKCVAFTKRIIVYNETFAPLGVKRNCPGKNTIPFAITWHEAEGGRSSQEISSTYIKYIKDLSNRDVRNFVLWVDNCSAQNKCWYLYTALCHAVNDNRNIMLQTITLKYFERGHSFMSADSYHRLVEKGMHAAKNVYDFQEFVDILDIDGKAILMKASNFINFPRGVSKHSQFTKDKPMLDRISIAKFIRGNTKLFWKESFGANFKSAEFLQKKLSRMIIHGTHIFPELYPKGERGVPLSRRDDIFKKLVALMPANRRLFWQHIDVNNDESNDDQE